MEPPASLTAPSHNRILELKRTLVDHCDQCSNGYIGGINKNGTVNGAMCSCLSEVMYERNLAISNIPPKYKSAEWVNFINPTDPGFVFVNAFAGEITRARQNGTGLHIFSEKMGAGKTLLGSCVLKAALRAGHTVWFTSVTELLDDIRSWENPQARERAEWAMFGVDFLMLDEIEKFHNNEKGWVDDRLNDLVQRRVNNIMPIISTGNVSLEQLSSKYKSHLVSRFRGTMLETYITAKVEYRIDVQRKALMSNLFNGEADPNVL